VFKSVLLLLSLTAANLCRSQSIYTARPDDPKAVYLESSDGSSDQSSALQNAIDRVQETTHHGIVFVPQGRYRLEHTVHVWAGIRLIGYGAQRPVFLLPAHSPDFQGGSSHYMLWFTDERTRAGEPIADASEFTFYSGLSNIDFDLAEDNPDAVAIRFNVAQHSFVSHANFSVGSAKAALEAIGNQASDIHVHGGQYGIVTGKTSPAWQFLLMDSSFDGQQRAAISTHEAGFTLVRDRISNVPVAVEIPAGQVEQLYARDLQLDHVSQTAFQMGDVQNLRNEITLTNIACSHVTRFVSGAEAIESNRSKWHSAPFYVEEQLTLGLEIGPDGRERGIQLRHGERVTEREPKALATDIPALPPMAEWTNIQALGAKGDEKTDDTAVIQKAIDSHRVLYFPSGLYRLTGSLRLRPDSVLIGLHPYSTEFVLNDNEPAFQGNGAAIGLFVSPAGGRTILTGFGVATGNGNPRAAGVDWRAGERSMIDDVEFIRWHNHGPFVRPGAGPKPELDAQYPSLWVHDGGGGIFRDIWSHSGMAKLGLLVENTDTPGRIYQLSNEHHMRREVRFDRVSNWTVYDLQTEEEKPEGAEAFSVDLSSSRNLLFVNTYMYRVSRNITPQLYAVLAEDAENVTFSNVKVFSQTRLPFDNSIVDQKSGVQVRAHHFVQFVLNQDVKKGAVLPVSSAFASGAKLERLATGYSNASGLTADDSGAVYFTDAAMHSVYKYAEGGAKLLAKTEEMPQILGYAGPSSLLAVNWERSVSSINPGTGEVMAVSPTDTRAQGTVLLLPTGLHNEEIQLEWLLKGVGYKYRIGSNTATRSDLLPQRRYFYYAPETKTAIMTGDTQKAYAGWVWRPVPESSQLAPFSVGAERYLTSEDDEKTYLGALESENKLNVKVAIERGGTAVVTDTAGNVYIASGQIYVYDKEGRQTGIVELPERPSSLAIGGKGRRTLYIGARSSLYAIELANAGG
jgi:Pectate lyase superfamily protein/SMP-30/Gluconolactonase/LRE-like region